MRRVAERSAIEWTEATWNPVTGCSKVSEGCDNCYAEQVAHRFAGTKAYPRGFEPSVREDRLDQPLRWRRPRRIFVNSMSDLFHPAVPDAYLDRVFDVMEAADHHTFQILTKRPARMISLIGRLSACIRLGLAQLCGCDERGAAAICSRTRPSPPALSAGRSAPRQGQATAGRVWSVATLTAKAPSTVPIR